ncbi:excisionase family DNA binding protein [Haloactinopolyspora alba]|uniref:Excisionase family DNA binding protein n=1 Tax=Haloactinopolyspora alba TaxID=648780 RepID=A0A2P8EBB6_9ACTN|nr:helix-turn-helix domain-containing protein [Haloactinopolyspora alba]PSL06762.1 excisionase family DNA binding protein [Haloactinopolyspora alba]
MPDQLYSVDQVATLLGLHVKTVRGYVRDGRLPATRIGKQYRIAREDLEAFTGRPVTAPSGAARTRRHAEVSAVVQIDAISGADVSRLTTLVTASASGRAADQRPLRVETMYDEERASLKIVIVGGLEDCAEMLKTVNLIAEEQS